MDENEESRPMSAEGEGRTLEEALARRRFDCIYPQGLAGLGWDAAPERLRAGFRASVQAEAEQFPWWADVLDGYRLRLEYETVRQNDYDALCARLAEAEQRAERAEAELRAIIKELDGRTEPLHPLLTVCVVEGARRALHPDEEARDAQR